ncbi:DUF6415 family natural product biosynthesis protein [Streptomyces niveus]|uniref:DUF6415 family natural product biosynthesis protein n=1 Tax=Streptomyces niveus TaxID=193462 RepID=UPI00372089B6
MHAFALAETYQSEAHPAGHWTPPLDADGLARIAELLRDVKPLDEILDDIGDVLANQDPRQSEFEDTAERLHAGLTRLVAIAKAAEDRDAEVLELVEQASVLRSEELPGDYRQAIGHLRRLARVANDLLERLTTTKTMKEIA